MGRDNSERKFQKEFLKRNSKENTFSDIGCTDVLRVIVYDNVTDKSRDRWEYIYTVWVWVQSGWLAFEISKFIFRRIAGAGSAGMDVTL